jgi:outer membrane protein assembly factor BamD (BamD/ComL family)
MNLRELEFIETGIYAAFVNSHYKCTVIYMDDTYTDDAIVNAKTFLNKYPATRLLDAIPVILRALSYLDSIFLGIRNPSELLKYVLYRLQCMTPEK